MMDNLPYSDKNYQIFNSEKYKVSFAIKHKHRPIECLMLTSQVPKNTFTIFCPFIITSTTS